MIRMGAVSSSHRMTARVPSRAQGHGFPSYLRMPIRRNCSDVDSHQIPTGITLSFR